MDLSGDVIVGNLAGNFRKRIHKGMKPLKLILDFSSSRGHAFFFILQYISTL